MMKGEGSSHNVQLDGAAGAGSPPVNPAIAHLKVKGTASVATLATSSRTTAQTTRILRSARSPGQIYGHRCTSVPIRVAFSAEFWEAGSVSSAPGAEW